jgi:hypothetical protein
MRPAFAFTSVSAQTRVRVAHAACCPLPGQVDAGSFGFISVFEK